MLPGDPDHDRYRVVWNAIADRRPAIIAWGRATMAALKPFTRPGNYVNDLVESDVDVVRAAYGDQKYQRLVGLKRAYDPDNAFRLNQNIRP